MGTAVGGAVVGDFLRWNSLPKLSFTIPVFAGLSEMQACGNYEWNLLKHSEFNENIYNVHTQILITLIKSAGLVRRSRKYNTTGTWPLFTSGSQKCGEIWGTMWVSMTKNWSACDSHKMWVTWQVCPGLHEVTTIARCSLALVLSSSSLFVALELWSVWSLSQTCQSHFLNWGWSSPKILEIHKNEGDMAK